MTDAVLSARIDDMLRRAERGEAVWSRFLNETERAEAEAYLRGRLEGMVSAFFGGYEGAQRTRLFIYPDYYDFSDISDCISAVEIRGSGYEKLTHSSFLGALTSLGIDRAKMGDIVVRGNSGILFADSAIVRFLLDDTPPLTRVARDSVKLFEFTVPKDFIDQKEFKDIFDTLSSPRLDAVVAALSGVSREKAKGLCLGGSVLVNHILQERPDAEIRDGDVITVRGFGKFIVVSLAEKTKKDRHKLIAKKYI